MRSTEPLPPAAQRFPSLSSASDVALYTMLGSFPSSIHSLPSQRMEETPSRFAKKSRLGVFLDWNSVKAGSPSPCTDGIAGVSVFPCTRITPSLVATNNWLGVLPERSLNICSPKPCVAPPIGYQGRPLRTVGRKSVFERETTPLRRQHRPIRKIEFASSAKSREKNEMGDATSTRVIPFVVPSQSSPSRSWKSLRTPESSRPSAVPMI